MGSTHYLSKTMMEKDEWDVRTVDDRGRITLPEEMRADAFAVAKVRGKVVLVPMVPDDEVDVQDCKQLSEFTDEQNETEE